jgi:hypothetical protein
MLHFTQINLDELNNVDLAKLVTALVNFVLRSNHISLQAIITQAQLAKKLKYKDETPITRSKHHDNARFKNTEAIEVVQKIANCFELAYWRNKEGTFTISFISEKAMAPYTGIWLGYFVRDEHIAEVALMIGANGDSYYRTDSVEPTYGRFEPEPNNFIWGNFKDNEVHFTYVLKLYEEPEKENSIYLSGLYAGHGRINMLNPSGGMVFFRFYKSWLGDAEEMKSRLNAIKLHSYSLKSHKQTDDLLAKENAILNFFFGKIYNDIKIETIDSWQRMGLVPRFKLTARHLTGKYIIYRLGTSRKRLIRRTLQIFQDGRCEMKLNRFNNEKSREAVYKGRIHFYESHFCIAIDRVISDEIEKGAGTNRTLYLFNAQNISDRNQIEKRIKGLELIINGAKIIRSSENILVKEDELDEKKQKPSAIIDILHDSDEKKIFNYLRKQVVLTAMKTPSEISNDLEREAVWGTLYFESACYYGLKNKNVTGYSKVEYFEKCLLNLQKAFEHGFGVSKFDIVTLEKALKKDGDLSHLEKNIKGSEFYQEYRQLM